MKNVTCFYVFNGRLNFSVVFSFDKIWFPSPRWYHWYWQAFWSIGNLLRKRGSTRSGITCTFSRGWSSNHPRFFGFSVKSCYEMVYANNHFREGCSVCRGGRDAFDSNRVRLTTRARANRIVRARRRRRRRANAKAVREEDGRHRWRLAVAQSTR